VSPVGRYCQFAAIENGRSATGTTASSVSRPATDVERSMGGRRPWRERADPSCRAASRIQRDGEQAPLDLGQHAFLERQRPVSNAWNLGMGNGPKTPLPTVAQSNA